MSNIKSEFDELKRFAIADILSVSGKQKTTETIEMHINTIIDVAFLKGQQAQQSKIDALTLQFAEMKSRLNDAYTDGQSAMYAARQSKIDELTKQRDSFIKAYEIEMDESVELQKRLDALTLALDQIAYPIPHMQKEAELNGCELNGYWAVKMSEDHTYSKDIARRALEKEQALKGGSDESN